MTTGPLWDLIGRTMLHTLWVGSLIGLAAGLGRLVLGRASAEMRYAHVFGSLMLLGLSPLAIGWYVSPKSMAPPPRLEALAPILRTQALPIRPTFAAPAPPAPMAALDAKPSSLFDILIPVVPYVWITGTPLTFAVLPPAALSGWTPEEIEFVLLHELIHARRGDNLVQLLQSLIESFLFFHPAAWLISGWVRRDREHCCDLAVVARTGRPVDYARALLSLSGHPSPPACLGLAMARHPVVARIHHLLGHTEEPMRHGTFSRMWIGSLALLLLAPALLVLAQSLPAPSRTDPARERTLQALEASARDPNSGDTSQRVNTLINLARVRAQSGQAGRAKELLAFAADMAAKGKQTIRTLEASSNISFHASKFEVSVVPEPGKADSKPAASEKAERSGLVATGKPMGSDTTFVSELGTLKPGITTEYGPSPRELLFEVAREQSRMGDRPAALDTLERAARTIESEEDFFDSRLASQATLAGLFQVLGRPDRARDIAQELERQAIPTPTNPRFVWVPHVVQAHCAAGDPGRGFAYLDQAMAASATDFERDGIQSSTIHQLCRELQFHPEGMAPAVLAEVRRRVEASKSPLVLSQMGIGLAMCLASRGEIDDAIRLADSAPDNIPGFAMPMPKWHVHILESAAATCRLRGQNDRAIVLRERAIRESSRVKDSPLSSGILAEQLLATGDVARIAAMVPSVPRGDRWRILALISRFQKERGRSDAAAKTLTDALDDAEWLRKPESWADLVKWGVAHVPPAVFGFLPRRMARKSSVTDLRLWIHSKMAT